MLPVATPEEMAAIDAASTESYDVLVGRAGAAVASAAIDMLGGADGRRVVVVAGAGSNGADGRVAGDRLQDLGVQVLVLDAEAATAELPAADLVVDAAYGTGLSRPYAAPATDSPVLAVDLPSGIDGLTGCELGSPVTAERTVTFAALKPGHLLGQGPEHCGEVSVVDIGLDVSMVGAALVEPSDVVALVPARPRDDHKWKSACWIVAGSPGMEGAAHLAARATQRSGAGYVRLSVPGGGSALAAPLEVVAYPIPADLTAPDDHDRFAALVLGPGLGPVAGDAVRSLLEAFTGPAVVDGDGLRALGLVDAPLRPAPTVLTPHDGEFERLTGSRPGPDRLSAARGLAVASGAVVLLKGPTTVVAAPDGRVRLAASGDQRLATAGTGDVLAGILGAFVARGADPFDAAAAAAVVHGLTVRDLPATGVVAGDLDQRLPELLSSLLAGGPAEEGS
ncbi:MAG: NAD(P)H-hydrate dehydratase [Actinomycetota bacterium]|nr:NAD(P)H-hydrate dehydratase [Actinomycetota bacterium]